MTIVRVPYSLPAFGERTKSIGEIQKLLKMLSSLALQFCMNFCRYQWVPVVGSFFLSFLFLSHLFRAFSPPVAICDTCNFCFLQPTPLSQFNL